MPLSRRNFFTRSGLIAAGAFAAPVITQSSENRSFRAGQRPRHIIHLVADGMSAGTLTCADHLSQLQYRRGLAWIDLFNDPTAACGMMNMRSLNSLVTDSSAASSSWGSGSRINNGAVNVLPDGTELRPLYTLFKQKGWKRGLVTTTEITHATPAGFAANDATRNSAENIALQYLDRQVDLLLGGGYKFFDPAKRKDKVNLLGRYADSGYEIFRTSTDLLAAHPDRRWIGLFSESHLPFTIDHLHSEKLKQNVPTLAVMTDMALRKLQREPHFILQVEGGRVDHGCHDCDAVAALHDLIAFDEALRVCLDFQRRVPDTLLVITTDHGNGNLGLNGIGEEYEKTSQSFAKLPRVHASFAEITKKIEKASSPAEIQKPIADLTGYEVPLEKAEMLLPFIIKKGKTMFNGMNSLSAQLGQLFANYHGVSFTGGAHTADYVTLTAKGPGAEHFRGFIQNTDVFRHYLAFAKIDYRNPQMPLQASSTLPPKTENIEEYLLPTEQAA